MEMLFLLKCKTEKIENLKAPLRDGCFIIQIPNRQKRKSWEVSQILIRHDQRALYTAAVKWSFTPWHFWVREHFTVGLCAWEIREETEKRSIKRGLATLLQVVWRVLALSCASHLCILVSRASFISLIMKAFHTPELPVLLDRPQMSTWRICRTMSALGAHFLQFLSSLWLSCSQPRNRHLQQGSTNRELNSVMKKKKNKAQ